MNSRSPLVRSSASRLLALGLVWLSGLAPGSDADLIVMHPPDELISLSEVIAIGKIAHVRQMGVADLGQLISHGPVLLPEDAPPNEVEVHEAEMQAEVVLKGSHHVRQGRLCFQFPRRSPGTLGFASFDEFRPGDRWLVFLRAVRPELEPVAYTCHNLQIPADVAMPSRLEGSAKDRLEQLIVWLVRFSRRDWLSRMIDWLRLFTCPAAGSRDCGLKPANVRGVAPLLHAEDADVRLRAAIILCAARHAPAIPVLVAECDAIAGDALAQQALYLLHACVTTEALAYVAPLLFHRNPRVREQVAYLVRDIRDPAGIPYLVTLLDDRESSVRESAVNGLAQLSGQMDRWVSGERFSQEEAKHIAYWKQWWAEGGAHDLRGPAGAKSTLPPTKVATDD